MSLYGESCPRGNGVAAPLDPNRTSSTRYSITSSARSRKLSDRKTDGFGGLRLTVSRKRAGN
jgi:hypothetical protein